MNQRRESKPYVYSPLVSFFLAAVTGILLNAWFSPSVFVWRLTFWCSILCYLLSRGALLGSKWFENSRALYVRIPGASFVPWRWCVCAFLSGNVWIWTACLALAGFRHEYWVNYFPENEIGLYVPDEGVGAAVELRVTKTPVLSVYDDGRKTFGEESSTFLTGALQRVKSAGEWKEYSGKIAVSISGDASELRTGDLVRITGRLTRPPEKSNPWERDKNFYYRAQRILTVLRVNSPDDVELIGSNDHKLKIRLLRALECVRLKAADVVRNRLSERNASVAAGMTLGFRNEVDDETRDAFARTGTIHLLAISGLHVMLVTVALAFVLRVMGLSQELVGLATLIFVLIYMGLTDMRPSVVRATVLVSIICIGNLIRRQGFLLNSLACAALVLLALNPCELFQPGAQLSFLAAGTFLWSDSVTIYEKALSNTKRREAVKRRRRLKQRLNGAPHKTFWGRVMLPLWRRIARYSWAKIRGVTITGAVIWLIGTPLILTIANLFTPIAIIANPLIWLPAAISLLLSFLLEFVGLCAGFGYFPFLTDALLKVVSFAANQSFDVFLGILDFLSSVRGGVYHLPAPSTGALLLFYVPLIFWTLFPYLRPKRRYVLFFVVAAFSFNYGVREFETRAQRSGTALIVDVFSVGHGCAVLGRFSDGRTFLYDCGSMENNERAAELVAKNLWNSGRSTLDLVILSHADLDHYGGMETLLELVKVKTVCVSPAMFRKENFALDSLKMKLAERRVTVEEKTRGASLDDVGFPELFILHPERYVPDEALEDSNGNSVVMGVEYLGRTLLFPGDLDTEDAPFLETPPRKCDFLLAPHHGGHSINAEALYAWANPSVVGISGGVFVRSRALEEELRAQGRRVAHTFDDGDVQITIKQDAARPDGRGVFQASTYKTRRTL